MAPKASISKKRKIDTVDGGPPVKKSPLFGLPQNHYAPKASMSREELAAWRKEQRRERNRQSAADSRNKTKMKIEQLEGEVNMYKSLCDDMKIKMEQMEEQIRFLTAKVEQNVGERCFRASSSVEQPTITPSGSYPSSPSSSTASQASHPVAPLSNYQLPFFPPLLSSPADCAPIQVTSQSDIAAAAATVASLKDCVTSPVDSKEHLIKQISRQAVKITGAISFESLKDATSVSEVEASGVGQPLTKMNVRNSVLGGQEYEDQNEDSTSPDSLSVEESAVDGVVSADEGEPLDMQSSLDDDGDLLDLLVDTLDCEFDPNLIV